jgi:malonate-semialdehyde dehydrogenase (acetylating)/methylmalonate-semialdehyde dehydrogenase
MTVQNYINGAWHTPDDATFLDVLNPATGHPISQVPLTPPAAVDEAVHAAQAAFPGWRATPVTDRIQVLFHFKHLLEDNLNALARTITEECGKTFAESLGEIRRGIENVEVACGTPTLMQGQFNENIARGIDEFMIRQPLGVVTAITPFNFPAMIPLWFLPYALATGNCFILKPSEKVPLSSEALFELIDELDLPPGVCQLVNGGRETVEALLDHDLVRAVSFVGSTPVARAVYSRATANGKRAQCQGGAKNPVIIMPDADMDTTTRIMADSAFGCAGQRCLASSVAMTVGEAQGTFADAIAEAAATRKVGYGLADDVQMGPVITGESRQRIEGLIQKGADEGAAVLVDGRGKQVPDYEGGYFVFPTVLDAVPPEGEIASTEIFGPVLSLMHAQTVEEAIELVNRRRFGNMACIFTSSGATARQFRSQVDAGNVGINIGVAAPMAFFPFSGWNDSFFGDLHAQGRHGVEFYTQTKVVVERWFRDWSRKF